MASTHCNAPDCAKALTGAQRKWCSRQCQQRTHARKTRQLQAEVRDDPVRLRHGKCYEWILDLGLYELWTDGEVTYQGVAQLIADAGGPTFHASTVTSSLQAMRIERRIEALDEDWEMDPEVRDMLCLDPAPDEDGDELEAWLDRAVDSFLRFEAEFFTTPRGPYLRMGFHREWIRETLRAIVRGSSLLILSPPRHGKTELLTHFCVWLICRDPDIRILWVGGNGDIAGDAVTACREHLEHNDRLIKSVLPPSQSFAPRGSRSGKTWAASKFTVACRQAVGAKSPTMVAVGRAGKILSKDVDFLIADDIEDFDSTEQPANREKTRTWFLTQLDSRVEEHTAWVTIGSRQHTDDLYSYLLEDDNWSFIVNAAHDPACLEDPHKDELHTDCMLFGDLRSHRWLRMKRESAQALGREHLFEMVYLNDPRPEGLVFWTRELIQPALDTGRGLGIPEDRNLYLVGGLDPSAVNYQGAFLWGIDLDNKPFPELMVDLDNRLGGGTEAFLVVARRWLEEYGLRHWVIEINMYRKGFMNDPVVMNWCSANNVIIEQHETQDNKNDPYFGVGAMKRKYEESPPIVNLPYGDATARAKTELYITQLLRFTDDAKRLKRRTTDVLMASWFPQMVIRRMKSARLAEVHSEEEPSFSGFDLSDYDRSSM